MIKTKKFVYQKEEEYYINEIQYIHIEGEAFVYQELEKVFLKINSHWKNS